MAVLAGLLAGNASAFCLLSSAGQPSRLPCHHELPSHSHPANHSCCVATAHAALPSAIFARAVAQESTRGHKIASPSISRINPVSTNTDPGSGPPAALTLRI